MISGDKLKVFGRSVLHFGVPLAVLALICWALHADLKTYCLVFAGYLIAFYQGLTEWVVRHGWKTFNGGSNGGFGKQQYQQQQQRREDQKGQN